MPIYEFYCRRCHRLFNFFARSVNTSAIPHCPRCKKTPLTRQMSLFAVTGRAKESQGNEDAPIDVSRMEKAVQVLASEAERVKEDDPRQAADLMRKLSRMTGMQLGQGMEEALNRMEQGEDPEQIEAQMGDLLEKEDPFVMPEKAAGIRVSRSAAPSRDETLYDLDESLAIGRESQADCRPVLPSTLTKP
jgi:putative FmdB family regulatory protein